MQRAFEEVLQDALSLSIEERHRLVQELHASLMTDEECEIEEAWVEEAERRIADVKAGRVKTIPGEEVFRKLREKYGFVKNPEPSAEWWAAWIREAERRDQRLRSGEDPGLTLEEFWSDED